MRTLPALCVAAMVAGCSSPVSDNHITIRATYNRMSGDYDPTASLYSGAELAAILHHGKTIDCQCTDGDTLVAYVAASPGGSLRTAEIALGKCGDKITNATGFGADSGKVSFSIK